eukprot:3936732-Rhodomonas_salina.2
MAASRSLSEASARHSPAHAYHSMAEKQSRTLYRREMRPLSVGAWGGEPQASGCVEPSQRVSAVIRGADTARHIDAKHTAGLLVAKPAKQPQQHAFCQYRSAQSACGAAEPLPAQALLAGPLEAQRG